MKIPSYMRFQIAAINDLCIDIGLAGKYQADADLSVSRKRFDLYVTTLPIGKRHTDPEAITLTCHFGAITQPGWGAVKTPENGVAHCRAELEAIIEHLDRLLGESQENDA